MSRGEGRGGRAEGEERGREGGERANLVADDEKWLSMSLHFDDDGLEPGYHVQVGLPSAREGGEGGVEGGRGRRCEERASSTGEGEREPYESKASICRACGAC